MTDRKVNSKKRNKWTDFKIMKDMKVSNAKAVFLIYFGCPPRIYIPELQCSKLELPRLFINCSWCKSFTNLSTLWRIQEYCFSVFSRSNLYID